MHALIDVQNDMTEFSENYVDGVSEPDNMTHIKFENCKFRYNGSHHGSLINITFKNMIQNIDIKGCNFFSNVSLEEPLLNFENLKDIADAWANGSTTQTLVYGTK